MAIEGNGGVFFGADRGGRSAWAAYTVTQGEKGLEAKDVVVMDTYPRNQDC